RRVTVLGQAAQVVFDPARLELRHIGRRVGPEKGDMVEHAAALGDGWPLHNVQNRLAVVIEPGAGERERRPRAGGEAEDVAIEGDRLFGVGGQDGEMVHPGDRHGALPSLASAARRDRLVASACACQVYEQSPQSESEWANRARATGLGPML